MLSLSNTIAEAKAYLRKHFEVGCKCPACGQDVKQYKRKLTSGMAKALINLYFASKRDPNKSVHITQLGHLNGGEFAQLERWGLIREQPNDSDEKRTSGTWSITRDGIAFVEGFKRVPSHVYTYDGKTIKFEETSTDIVEALGNKFNYQELMHG